ncbi:kinase-like domain-containing protein [Chytridium lagenaria]|nr:kinase-like domain-containing protein [Chytridium lagenaria]
MRKFSAEHHPNIITFYEHFELNGKYIIAMEYLGEDWVDLYDYIELFGPVREDVTVEIFGQVVETIMYLHRRGYHHNDIKDENILINTKTRVIKLIDFGSATSVDPYKTCDLFYGTKKFAAPEAVRGEPYYPESQEVWALGTLLFVLLFKLDPFTTDDEILTVDIGKRIERYREAAGGGVGLDISEEAVKSLKMMMEKDWARRIKLSEIRGLPVFKKHPDY